jgi:uncharacterized membrane protein YbhN (UPF0104 family)
MYLYSVYIIVIYSSIYIFTLAGQYMLYVIFNINIYLFSPEKVTAIFHFFRRMACMSIRLLYNIYFHALFGASSSRGRGRSPQERTNEEKRTIIKNNILSKPTSVRT